MGSLEKFIGKPKVIEIDFDGKMEKVELHHIRASDLHLFGKSNPTPEEAEEIANKMIVLSVPGTTEEQVKALPLAVFKRLVDEIKLLNGLEDERTRTIKQNLKQ